MANVTAAANPFTPFDEDQFLNRGLEMRSSGRGKGRWKNRKKETQLEDFRASYGAHPKALASIWISLHTTPFLDCRIDSSAMPDHVLLGYC